MTKALRFTVDEGSQCALFQTSFSSPNLGFPRLSLLMLGSSLRLLCSPAQSIAPSCAASNEEFALLHYQAEKIFMPERPHAGAKAVMLLSNLALRTNLPLCALVQIFRVVLGLVSGFTAGCAGSARLCQRTSCSRGICAPSGFVPGVVPVCQVVPERRALTKIHVLPGCAGGQVAAVDSRAERRSMWTFVRRNPSHPWGTWAKGYRAEQHPRMLRLDPQGRS